MQRFIGLAATGRQQTLSKDLQQSLVLQWISRLTQSKYTTYVYFWCSDNTIKILVEISRETQFSDIQEESSIAVIVQTK